MEEWISTAVPLESQIMRISILHSLAIGLYRNIWASDNDA